MSRVHGLEVLSAARIIAASPILEHQQEQRERNNSELLSDDSHSLFLPLSLSELISGRMLMLHARCLESEKC